MYRIDFTKTARQEVAQFEKSEPQVFKKIEKLLLELVEHPYTGTGKPKQLSGDRTMVAPYHTKAPPYLYDRGN